MVHNRNLKIGLKKKKKKASKDWPTKISEKLVRNRHSSKNKVQKRKAITELKNIKPNMEGRKYKPKYKALLTKDSVIPDVRSIDTGHSPRTTMTGPLIMVILLRKAMQISHTAGTIKDVIGEIM